MKAQHVSSSMPLIIRSSKLYLQPLVYIHMWWPAVVKSEWDFPLRLDNGQSPHVYINQRLQVQFRAPDDVWFATRNLLSLEVNVGIINSLARLLLVGYFYLLVIINFVKSPSFFSTFYVYSTERSVELNWITYPAHIFGENCGTRKTGIAAS